MPEFSLNDYVAAHRQELTCTVPIRPGAEVDIRYLPKKRWRAIQKGVERLRNQAARDAALEARMRNLLASAVVGWRGFTPQVVAELIPVDPAGLPEELPHNPSNVQALIEHSAEFSNLVMDEVNDLAGFRAEQVEEEQKN